MGEETIIVDLLKCLISVTGRVAFPEEKLLQIISPIDRGRSKAILAYNLCDGTRNRADVSAAAKIAQGNFSNLVKRWIEAGIVFELHDEKSTKLLHVYGLSESIENKEEQQ